MAEPELHPPADARPPFPWHEVAWHILATIIGLSAIVLPPTGLTAIVDPWLVRIWIALLFLGGLLGIWAPFRTVVNSLATERAALWVQTVTLVWVVASSIWMRGFVEGFGLVSYLVWITANVGRDRQIASGLRKAHRAAEAERNRIRSEAVPEE